MGPSFIKLGQMLSTRADLLGEQVAFDLAELQDHLPPFDSARARRILEEEFGQPVEALFVSFDPVPVSAASIAQVHNAMVMPEPGEGAEATASEPRPVAVKILRPGIERAFDRDIEFLYWLAEWVERAQPKLRRFRPVAEVRVFETTVRLEMALRMEGTAAPALAAEFADHATSKVPAITSQHRKSVVWGHRA